MFMAHWIFGWVTRRRKLWEGRMMGIEQIFFSSGSWIIWILMGAIIGLICPIIDVMKSDAPQEDKE